jgi:hypothetical protein
MKVNDRDLTGASAAESGRSQETQKLDRGTSSRSATAAEGTGDRVELSSTLSHLSRAIAAHGADRAGRVQALTTQFQSGQYRPSSRATSQSMVADALSSKAT